MGGKHALGFADDDRRVKALGDGCYDGELDEVGRDGGRVGAGRRASLLRIVAAVVLVLRFPVAREPHVSDHGPAADRTPGETSEQVLRVEVGLRQAAGDSALRGSRVRLLLSRQSSLHPGVEISVGDDGQLRDLDADLVPFLSLLADADLAAPVHDLLAAPHGNAAVDRVVEEVADRRSRPLRPTRTRQVVSVELPGDLHGAEAFIVEREQAADHGRLLLADLPLDVTPLSVRSLHVHQVVAEGLAACDVALLGSRVQCLADLRLDLLPLLLAGEVLKREEQLVHRSSEDALLPVEVREDPHARVDDLLDHVARLDGLTPDPGLVGDDQDVERRARRERREQARELGATEKLGTAHAVVCEDVIRPDTPAPFLGEGPGGLDLPHDGLRLGRRALLLGAFPGVDRGSHCALRMSLTRVAQSRCLRLSSMVPGCHAESQVRSSPHPRARLLVDGSQEATTGGPRHHARVGTCRREEGRQGSGTQAHRRRAPRDSEQGRSGTVEEVGRGRPYPRPPPRPLADLAPVNRPEGRGLAEAPAR